MCSAISLSVTVNDVQNDTLEGVVVYVQFQSNDTLSTEKYTAIDIRQKDKGFSPYINVIQSNSKVTFSNLDDITHHIYSVTGNEKFSYTIKSGDISLPLKIKHSGLIAMGCNIHDWMSGYILVVDTPYYGITNKDGNIYFNLENPGIYQIVVWHPQMNEKPFKKIKLNNNSKVLIKLSNAMSKIPEQKGVDDFDFLEGY